MKDKEYVTADEMTYKMLVDKIDKLCKENEKLLKIAKKMHLWIFLHSGDEQKVYDELGLTDEDNKLLGYRGQFTFESKGNE